MIDIFRNNAFRWSELTEAINIWPNKFGRLNQLNLFPAKPVRINRVTIERKNHRLNLLPSVPWGGPASKGINAKRDLREVPVPHFPHEDLVLAADVMGVRAFGTESQLESVMGLVNEKLEDMSNKHDITLEFLRWGALKGRVYDGDGALLLDLFDTFEITQEVRSFELDDTTTDVTNVITSLKTYYDLNLFGDTMSSILVFCSPEFFEALVGHPDVKEMYKYYQRNQPLGGDYRNRFEIAGVVFEQQNGSATDAAGNVHKFIEANEAIAVPIGTQSFRTYFAPADFEETVNTPGLARYAKLDKTKWDRGTEIHTQSNPLPIVLRPQLLVRLTRT